MTVSEFKASQSALVSEIQLLIMNIREMALDEDTSDFLEDEAVGLIGRTNDSVKERELDLVRRDLEGLQSAVHQAYKRNWTLQKERQALARRSARLSQEG